MELRRDSQSLDLRAVALTPDQFEEFRAAFPQARIRWTVPLSGGGRDSDAETIQISSLAESDIPLFGFFPALRAVQAERCTDYPALLALRRARPDLAVVWTVEIGSRRLVSTAERLQLPAALAGEDLYETLSLLPELRYVHFINGAVPIPAQDALRAAFPEIDFHWNVELLGRVFSSDAAELSWAGQALTEEDLALLRDNVFRFPAMERLDLTDCGLGTDELRPLAEALPGVCVVWTMELYGVTVSTDAAEIDLSLHLVRDGAAAVEEVLPCFPKLEKVIMTRCGLSNEEMDALNRRHEDVWFVWTVYFSIYSLRTDENNFIAARFVNHAELYSGQCYVLWYCTELQALDLGHKNLDDLTFLYGLPKLKWLILVENDLYDITPIGSLKDLIYLEIFNTKVEDISPLVNCKKLEDLNISYIYARPQAAFDALIQMPWLDRLWYCGCGLTEEQRAALREAMPACEMNLEPHAEPTGGGWREHPHYFAMRDFFGMYYMPGGTNGVDENGHQIVYRG